MLTFTAMELTPLYVLYLLIGFFMFFWVPYSFLGHLFMKYFTWHDILWGDEPSVNNSKLQNQLANNLNLPVSWRAAHIKGDGIKTDRHAAVPVSGNYAFASLAPTERENWQKSSGSYFVRDREKRPISMNF